MTTSRTSRPRRARPGRLGVMVLPPALVAVVYLCDALIARVPRWPSRTSVLLTGLLDEPGHLATALLVMLALVPVRTLLAHRRESVVALAFAVLIDLDHIPLYAGLPVSVGGRPFTHSLATVAVLGVVALTLPPGRRRWPLLVAAGVLMHFVRDVATGPGLALWWPLSRRDVLLPYGLYAATMAALAVVACVRLRPRRAPERHGIDGVDGVDGVSPSTAAPRPR